MSLYAELVRKAADQYRSQLDAIYAQQKYINHADQIANQLIKAGLQARALADADYQPFIVLLLTEDLLQLQKTVILYVGNVLERQIEDKGRQDDADCFLIHPRSEEVGQPGLQLRVEAV